MGTRSRVVFYENHRPLVHIYRQYDGYPEGRGRELAQFLTNANFSYGIQCVAAQWIAKEKTEAGLGNVYIIPPTLDLYSWGEDYIYFVDVEEGLPVMTVRRRNAGSFFYGSPEKFLEKLKIMRKLANGEKILWS